MSAGERVGVDRVLELLECVRWPNLELKPREPPQHPHPNSNVRPMCDVEAVAATPSACAGALPSGTAGDTGNGSASGRSCAAPPQKLGPNSTPLVATCSSTSSEVAAPLAPAVSDSRGHCERRSDSSSDEEGDGEATADAVEAELMRALGLGAAGGNTDVEVEGDASAAETFDSLLAQVTRFRGV